jgi:hypothetical protein
LLKNKYFCFDFGFGFGMLYLSVLVLVSVQTEPKYRNFGFGLKVGFGRSLMITYIKNGEKIRLDNLPLFAKFILHYNTEFTKKNNLKIQ